MTPVSKEPGAINGGVRGERQAYVPVSEERLAEMLAGLEGVTPGPWVADQNMPHNRMPRVEGGDQSCVCECGNMGSEQDRWEADAAHIARCDPETIRLIITELQALRSQSPEPSSSEVRVKGLEWNGDEAVTPFGKYRVCRTEDGYALTFEYEELAHIGFNSVGPFESAREDALRRAQADYEQRIRSALSPTVSQPGTGEEVEATKHVSERDGETLFSKGWVPNMLGFKSQPLYAAPPDYQALKARLSAVEGAGVERIMSWLCDDVLPAYGIDGSIARNDPEVAESAREALNSIKGASHEQG